MKNINTLISNISFEEAQNKINFQGVYEELSGKDNALFTYFIKSLIVLIIILAVPIVYLISVVQIGITDVSADKMYLYIMTNSIFGILLLLSLYIFYKLRILFQYLFFNHLKFLLTLFLLTELSIICYGSVFILGVYSSENIFIVLVSLSLYIIISCKLVLEIIVTKIYKVLNEEYTSNISINKWRLYLIQIPIVSVLLILGGMQMYRLSKSAFLISDTNISLLDLYALVGKIGLWLVAVIVTLLPTLFFNAHVFVKAKLLSSYSEEFRKEYDFTKEEWYGE